MVRKTKEATQETYTALLDAAEREFCARGVTYTTLADVATAAGMTRGAIYWHFKDKSALFQAMCDRAFLPMEALLHEITASAELDPIEGIRRMIEQMLIQVATNSRQRNVFDIIFHRCEKNDDMVFFVNEEEKRGECMSHMETIMQRAVDQGKLDKNTDTGLAVQALHGYMIGLIHEWLIDPEAYDLQRHALTMVDIFMAGLVARPPLRVDGATNGGDASVN